MKQSHFKLRPWRNLARQLWRDDRGAVSVETMLILAAIALPILIFIIKFGWPKIQSWFVSGINNLDPGAGGGGGGGGGGTTP